MHTLSFIKETLSQYFADQPVTKAWVFGSYARGEQTPQSDLDILVVFDENDYPSLLSHAGMVCDLEDLFNMKIDLVPQDNLYPQVRNSIEKNKILIYERN